MLAERSHWGRAAIVVAFISAEKKRTASKSELSPSILAVSSSLQTCAESSSNAPGRKLGRGTLRSRLFWWFWPVFGCLVVQLHDAHTPNEGVHTYTHESNYSSTRLPACPAGVSLSWTWRAACSCDLTFNSDSVQTGSFKHSSSFFETVVCHNTLDSGSTC